MKWYQFTFRDLVWLIIIVSILCCWSLDRVTDRKWEVIGSHYESYVNGRNSTELENGG